MSWPVVNIQASSETLNALRLDVSPSPLNVIDDFLGESDV